jgi:hypothetical protein
MTKRSKAMKRYLDEERQGDAEQHHINEDEVKFSLSLCTNDGAVFHSV